MRTLRISPCSTILFSFLFLYNINIIIIIPYANDWISLICYITYFFQQYNTYNHKGRLYIFNCHNIEHTNLVLCILKVRFNYNNCHIEKLVCLTENNWITDLKIMYHSRIHSLIRIIFLFLFFKNYDF